MLMLRKCVFILVCSLLPITAWCTDSPVILAFQKLAERSPILSKPIWPETADLALKKLIKEGPYTESECTSKVKLKDWSVRQISNSSITVHLCGSDDVIRIQLYQSQKNTVVAGLVYISGNHGQTQDFEFYLLDQHYTVLKKHNLKQLGVENVRWNEFVNEKERFLPKDNNYARFSMNEDGRIEAYPWTWMDPRWEHREVTKMVFFEWNGAKFVKRTKIRINANSSLNPDTAVQCPLA
jgi:hypothetical protein